MSTLQYSISRHYCAKQMTHSYITSTFIDSLQSAELIDLAREVLTVHRVLYNQNVAHATITVRGFRMEFNVDDLPKFAYELLAKSV